MYKHILIPTDGSPLCVKAVTHGVALAKETGAKITALAVTEPFHFLTADPAMLTDTVASYTAHAAKHADKALAMVAKAAAEFGVPCDTLRVEHSSIYSAIIETAHAKGCDLILMASHGRRGVKAVVLGSETLKVLTHSTIPVLVYR
ncbi:MAG TPA: universal stress protein [Candidatus Sulfotelmatobacter sp.]|nr:universal stress protein [Candidatus Sulfotelmatobacter sp.]